MRRERLVLIVAVMVSLGSGGGSLAGELPKAITYSGRAIVNSAQAVSTGVVASGQLVSGVVAAPLLISGAVGQVSTEAGTELWDAAMSPIGTPLPVAEEHITVGPPPDALLRGKATGPAAENE